LRHISINLLVSKGSIIAVMALSPNGGSALRQGRPYDTMGSRHRQLRPQHVGAAAYGGPSQLYPNGSPCTNERSFGLALRGLRASLRTKRPPPRFPLSPRSYGACPEPGFSP
jgi:hypothetical protein